MLDDVARRKAGKGQVGTTLTLPSLGVGVKKKLDDGQSKANHLSFSEAITSFPNILLLNIFV